MEIGVILAQRAQLLPVLPWVPLVIVASDRQSYPEVHVCAALHDMIKLPIIVGMTLAWCWQQQCW